MVKKTYFFKCIIFILFFQLQAMQKPQLAREEKLRRIVEKFETECDNHCYDNHYWRINCTDLIEQRRECLAMCRMFSKTFKEYNDVLKGE